MSGFGRVLEIFFFFFLGRGGWGLSVCSCQFAIKFMRSVGGCLKGVDFRLLGVVCFRVWGLVFRGSLQHSYELCINYIRVFGVLG